MAATQIDSLCPQVSKTLYDTTSQHIWMCFIHNNCFLELKLIDDRPINTASWMEEWKRQSLIKTVLVGLLDLIYRKLCVYQQTENQPLL